MIWSNSSRVTGIDAGFGAGKRLATRAGLDHGFRGGIGRGRHAAFLRGRFDVTGAATIWISTL